MTLARGRELPPTDEIIDDINWELLLIKTDWQINWQQTPAVMEMNH